MFLKRFKEKSNRKYIAQVLDKERSVPSGKVDSVGVLLNFEEFSDYDRMRKLLKGIGIKDNRVTFIALIADDRSRPNSWDDFFSPEDFGWKGKIKNPQLDNFVKTPFDALVCFYHDRVFEMDFVTAISQARLKIGISDHDPRLFDLIIRLEIGHLDIFGAELEKYLTVLNKL